jgi:hypothetical protein
MQKLCANLNGWYFLCCIVSNWGISNRKRLKMTYKNQGISACGEYDYKK